MKKILVMAVALLFAGAGCTTSYSTGDSLPNQPSRPSAAAEKSVMVEGRDEALGLTFEYPKGYIFEKSHTGSSDSVVWMTIRNGQDRVARVEVWNRAELKDRPYGFGESVSRMTQDELDDYMAKHIVDIGLGGKEYQAYIYYGAGKEVMRPPLDKILDSLKAIE